MSVVKVEQVREVSAVLVLFGLPCDLVASILAHEAMHVWIKLSKHIPFHLSPLVGLFFIIYFN
jgi:predicted RNA-binding protein (virulence factor B family)